jgi:hypothetical protein
MCVKDYKTFYMKQKYRQDTYQAESPVWHGLATDLDSHSWLRYGMLNCPFRTCLRSWSTWKFRHPSTKAPQTWPRTQQEVHIRIPGEREIDKVYNNNNKKKNYTLTKTNVDPNYIKPTFKRRPRWANLLIQGLSFLVKTCKKKPASQKVWIT